MGPAPSRKTLGRSGHKPKKKNHRKKTKSKTLHFPAKRTRKGKGAQPPTPQLEKEKRKNFNNEKISSSLGGKPFPVTTDKCLKSEQETKMRKRRGSRRVTNKTLPPRAIMEKRRDERGK